MKVYIENLKKFIQENSFNVIASVAALFLVILLLQSFSLYSMKRTFEKDNIVKSRQIQRLDAGISFEAKRMQFLIIARDSILKKHNPELTDDEAYNMAEYTLYICEKYKIDPVLFFAIARQESRFNTKAVSIKGASGIYQISPLTARMLCASLGMEYNEQMVFDLKTNMEMAGKYMSFLKAEYGKTDLILIGYNAGPSWADWQRKDSKITLPEETRDYLIRVQAYYEEFSKLLACYLPGSVSNG